VYSQASDSLKSNLSATSDFDNSVKAASESAKVLAENYTKSAEVLSKSADALDFTNLKENDYGDQLNKISQNLSSLNATYEMQLQNSKVQTESSGKLNETINQFVSSMGSSIDNTAKYQENLVALNAIFENQMKGTSDQVATTAKLKDTLDSFLEKLNESADKTVTYNNELDNLAKKVAALNTVYGNMLSAMNVK
jgi:chromosome segregation ATPase